MSVEEKDKKTTLADLNGNGDVLARLRDKLPAQKIDVAKEAPVDLNLEKNEQLEKEEKACERISGAFGDIFDSGFDNEVIAKGGYRDGKNQTAKEKLNLAVDEMANFIDKYFKAEAGDRLVDYADRDMSEIKREIADVVLVNINKIKGSKIFKTSVREKIDVVLEKTRKSGVDGESKEFLVKRRKQQEYQALAQLERELGEKGSVYEYQPAIGKPQQIEIKFYDIKVDKDGLLDSKKTNVRFLRDGKKDAKTLITFRSIIEKSVKKIEKEVETEKDVPWEVEKEFHLFERWIPAIKSRAGFRVLSYNQADGKVTVEFDAERDEKEKVILMSVNELRKRISEGKYQVEDASRERDQDVKIDIKIVGKENGEKRKEEFERKYRIGEKYYEKAKAKDITIRNDGIIIEEYIAGDDAKSDQIKISRIVNGFPTNDEEQLALKDFKKIIRRYELGASIEGAVNPGDVKKDERLVVDPVTPKKEVSPEEVKERNDKYIKEHFDYYTKKNAKVGQSSLEDVDTLTEVEQEDKVWEDFAGALEMGKSIGREGAEKSEEKASEKIEEKSFSFEPGDMLPRDFERLQRELNASREFYTKYNLEFNKKKDNLEKYFGKKGSPNFFGQAQEEADNLKKAYEAKMKEYQKEYLASMRKFYQENDKLSGNALEEAMIEEERYLGWSEATKREKLRNQAEIEIDSIKVSGVWKKIIGGAMERLKRAVGLGGKTAPAKVETVENNRSEMDIKIEEESDDFEKAEVSIGNSEESKEVRESTPKSDFFRDISIADVAEHGEDNEDKYLEINAAEGVKESTANNGDFELKTEAGEELSSSENEGKDGELSDNNSRKVEEEKGPDIDPQEFFKKVMLRVSGNKKDLWREMKRKSVRGVLENKDNGKKSADVKFFHQNISKINEVVRENLQQSIQFNGETNVAQWLLKVFVAAAKEGKVEEVFNVIENE